MKIDKNILIMSKFPHRVVEHFDETFNTNSVTVNFSYSPNVDENSYNFQLRLETDQIRDWHKPETFWFVKY